MLLTNWLLSLKRRLPVRSHMSRRRANYTRRRTAAQFGQVAEVLEDRTLLSNWSGHITADTTWSGTTEYIVGDLYIDAGVTLTINSGVTVETGSGFDDIWVAGTLKATGVTFTGDTEIVVRNGGRLELTNSNVAGETVEYQDGSNGKIRNTEFSADFRIHSGAGATVANSSFASAHVYATGDPAAEIDMISNYWGTTNSVAIEDKIDHRLDDPGRPLVLYVPFLDSWPPVASVAVTVSATDPDAREPANNGTYRIQRSGSTDSSLSVNFGITGTATRNTDYHLKQGTSVIAGNTVTIPAGQSSVDLTLDVIDDSIVELTESARLTLNAGTGYEVGTPGNATITIADDDSAGVTVTESGGNTVVAEGGATDTYTIALNSVPSGTVAMTVTADSQSQVSLNGTDFSNNVTFSRTDMTPQTITVRAVDDTVVEGTHTTTITHAITSSSDGDYPTTMSIASVIGTVTDSVQVQSDFGDAASPYPTTLVEDGARHVATGPTLGVNRDTEADGSHSISANADDTNGSPDDEDGVTFDNTIYVGQLGARVTVNVRNAPNGAKLDGWIDFNQDGSWGGPFEHIADSVAVQNGDNTVSVTVHEA